MAKTKSGGNEKTNKKEFICRRCYPIRIFNAKKYLRLHQKSHLFRPSVVHYDADIFTGNLELLKLQAEKNIDPE
jgi:hypothetical protein